MTIRVPRRSTIALATAGALASTGTAYLGARNLLAGQASQARTVIPKSWPDDRYDVIWTFTLAADDRYAFGQIPQLLLSGDADTVIT